MKILIFAAAQEGSDMEYEYTPSEEGDTPLFGMHILDRVVPSGDYISPTSTEPSIAHYDQEANDPDADMNAQVLWKTEEEMQPGKCGVQQCTNKELFTGCMACKDHWKEKLEKDNYKRLCMIRRCERQVIGVPKPDLSDCRCHKHGGKKVECSVVGCDSWGNVRKVEKKSVGKFCKVHWEEKKQSLLVGNDATGNSGGSRSADDENADPQQSNANISTRHL